MNLAVNKIEVKPLCMRGHELAPWYGCGIVGYVVTAIQDLISCTGNGSPVASSATNIFGKERFFPYLFSLPFPLPDSPVKSHPFSGRVTPSPHIQ